MGVKKSKTKRAQGAVSQSVREQGDEPVSAPPSEAALDFDARECESPLSEAQCKDEFAALLDDVASNSGPATAAAAAATAPTPSPAVAAAVSPAAGAPAASVEASSAQATPTPAPQAAPPSTPVPEAEPVPKAEPVPEAEPPSSAAAAAPPPAAAVPADSVDELTFDDIDVDFGDLDDLVAQAVAEAPQ